MIWYDAKPRDSFEDEKSEKLISLLSSLSSFGIILSKKDSTLTLYLGAEESESHHITSLSDVSSDVCDVSDVLQHDVTLLKLKNDYVHPLCVAVEPCKIYDQSSMLSDFTFGIICRRIDPKIIRRRAKSFLEKIKKHSKDIPQNDITKPIEWKLEQNSFFATSVFFSCNKASIPSFLSSINFTNILSEPNALVPKNRRTIESVLNNLPKLSWLGGAKTPVLSLIELASVLSFPNSMFGIEMQTGKDRTFSNIHSTIDDPADFFSDLTDRK